jgi:hypothetical protein
VNHDLHELVFFGLGFTGFGEVFDARADAVDELADVVDLLVGVCEEVLGVLLDPFLRLLVELFDQGGGGYF